MCNQRLRAQNIPQIRGQKVINEIAATFLNEKFLHEIFKPQLMYTNQELYLLFKEIAHASVMKLNDISMGKLYDLMIMVFKHQLYFSRQPRDLLLITLNHLDSLRNLVSSPSVYQQLDSVYCIFMKTYFSMQEAELLNIRYSLLNYLQDIRIKVSVFLRLGQQSNDGTFVHPFVENIPNGYEIPGVMKVFNHNESIKDIITFSAGGEYVYEQEKSSYDLKGKRGTTLGLSIYGENFSAQDFPWSSENNLDSQIVVNADACDYRSEIITLMSQLLGNKRESDAHETISLDLFVNTYNEKESHTNPKEKIKTVTLNDVSHHRNTVLETIASEISIVDDEPGYDGNKIFHLLENTE